jgi:flagellar biogenesis protein FliO
MKTPATRRLAAAIVVLGVGSAVSATAAEVGALAASLPLRRDGQAAAEASLWLPLLVVLVVAALAAGYVVWQRGASALFAGRGRSGQAARTPLVRLSSQPLTPQASVHVVQWQGDEFLLACTAQQVTLLARKAAPPARQAAP